MKERILVTGGTGTLGREVVRRLIDGGHTVRATSRSLRSDESCEWVAMDLLAGTGVAEAVADVGVIVHCATAVNRSKEIRIVETLVEAARRAGSPHLVYISIVGVDRVPLGYYQGKYAAEQIIEQSGLPYTIVRATQFHDLIRAMLAATAKFPVMAVPAVPDQPIDVRVVADRLVELALEAPAGRVPDIGGPEVRDLRDLAHVYLAATGRRRLLLPIVLPGKTFRAYRQGGHLAPENAVGGATFEQFLAEHSGLSSVSYRSAE